MRMIQTIRRFFILPVLALTLGACGSSSSADDLKATRAAALTALVVPTQTLAVATDAPTSTPTAASAATSMVTPSVTRTVTRPPVVNQPLCDDAAFVSDVTIPDNTVIQPGAGFVKTWSLRNTGTCNWTTSYAISFVSGNKMDGVITYLTKAVESGSTIEISIGLSAPTTPGTYTGYWRLKNADGNLFGELVYVQIVVPGSATATGTIATTASSATPTPEITNTPLPTATETQVPTSA
jgi:hypothetical protein